MLYFDIRLQHGRPRTGGTHHEEIKHAHRINYIFCIKTAGVSGFAASLFCTSLFNLPSSLAEKVRIYSQFVHTNRALTFEPWLMYIRLKFNL